MALLAHDSTFDAGHFSFTSLICSGRTGSQSKMDGSGGDPASDESVARDRLDHEHAANALLFTLEEHGLLFESATLGLTLVEEHVAIRALPSSDFPRPRDLESLRCRLVCSDLWHLFSALFAVLGSKT